ncbi:MAG TPA: GNAT family N-acetyltransferase [Anaerolineaceae bacterium]|nr:GNAT family N-acetyltransferase [Anaerolineaceae bacterium]
MLVLDNQATVTQDAHLRPLDVTRDLMEVADLIEQCFSATMDPDGQEYLRQMRRMARDASFLRWASGLAEKTGTPMSGFVWEDHGHVVGNLSLIPLTRQGKRVYLIANVAVYPEYRKNGIGTALTQRGIDHAHKRGAWAAWLQVRADNLSAYNIYRRLGFVERARRSTWQFTPRPGFQNPILPEAIVTPRFHGDWSLQERWLSELYPPQITWNLPLQLSRLKPGFFNDLFLFLSNETIRHWAARSQGKLVGVLTWQPSHTYADHLWLATRPEFEDQAIRTLLPRACRDLNSRRPIALNYPADQGVEALEEVGFEDHQTLVWMEIPFRSQILS